MAFSPRRHCRLDCRYEVDREDEPLLSIQYIDSSDDFEIVAGSLQDAFRLLGARGWHLSAVTHSRVKRRSVRTAGSAGVSTPVVVDTYYFSLEEEPKSVGEGTTWPRG